MAEKRRQTVLLFYVSSSTFRHSSAGFQQIPQNLTCTELFGYFTFTADDRHEILQCRGDHTSAVIREALAGFLRATPTRSGVRPKLCNVSSWDRPEGSRNKAYHQFRSHACEPYALWSHLFVPPLSHPVSQRDTSCYQWVAALIPNPCSDCTTLVLFRYVYRETATQRALHRHPATDSRSQGR